MNDLISVIIPIYNAEKTIVSTIESIRNQDYLNLEILLVDDGSVDDSLKICLSLEKRDKRIKVFSIKNSGPSYARQYGLDRANGRYIAFCDADDIMERNMISSLLSIIQSKECQLSICSYTKECFAINNKNNQVHVWNSEDTICKCLNEIAIGGFLWNKLFDYQIITRFDVRFDETVFFAEDLEFVIEYILHCEKIAYTSEVLYHYIENSDSLSSSGLSWGRLTNLFAREKILNMVNDAGLDKAIRFAKKELVLQSIFAGRTIEKASATELKKLTDTQLDIITKKIESNCLLYGASVVLHGDCSMSNIIKFIKFYLKRQEIKCKNAKVQR